MKKQIAFVVVAFIASTTIIYTSCSQASKPRGKDKKVELNWKIAKNDTLFYKTVMNPIGESTFDMDLGGLLNETEDHEGADFRKKSEQFLNAIKDRWNKTNLTTRLYNSNSFEHVVEVEMHASDNAGEESSDLEEPFKSFMKGIMLRGSIHKSGSLHSFWVMNSQKNLLSLFFELPSGPIGVGDSWTLQNVNFIGNDQNFACREADKKNEVILSRVEVIEGKTIATLEYEIMEYVLGDFNAPSFFGTSSKTTETEMKFRYKAEGQFSIEEGKWIAYNGIMSLDSKGALSSVQRQKFALIEEPQP